MCVAIPSKCSHYHVPDHLDEGHLQEVSKMRTMHYSGLHIYTKQNHKQNKYPDAEMNNFNNP